MARSFSSSTATLLILGLVLVAPAVEAMTCPQTVAYLAPCLPYLTGQGVIPPSTCCAGVKGLNNAAIGITARQAACACLKSAVAGIPRLIAARVVSLPDRCGVKLPYAVSPTTDCRKVT